MNVVTGGEGEVGEKDEVNNWLGYSQFNLVLCLLGAIIIIYTVVSEYIKKFWFNDTIIAMGMLATSTHTRDVHYSQSHHTLTHTRTLHTRTYTHTRKHASAPTGSPN